MQGDNMPSTSTPLPGKSPERTSDVAEPAGRQQESKIQLDLTDSCSVLPVRRRENLTDTNSVHSFSQVEGIERDNKLLEHTIFGPWKRWSRFEDNWEKVFLMVVLIALTFSLGMTVFKFTQPNLTSTDSTYGLILITATVFSYFYVVTGVFQEKPYNIMALVITTLIVWGYVLINYVNYRRKTHTDHTGKLVRLTFTTIFTVILVPLGCYLVLKYHSRKALITFSVGSVNNEAKKMVSRHFLFTSGIAFDLQLQVNFLILVLTGGVFSTSTDEWVVLVVGTIITIAWSIIGLFAVRKESKLLLAIFVIFTFPNLAYAVFKFYSLSNEDINQIFKLTILSGISALIVRLGLLILTYFVYKDFGRKLNELLYRYDNPVPTAAQPSVVIPGTSEERETPQVHVYRPSVNRNDSL